MRSHYSYYANYALRRYFANMVRVSTYRSEAEEQNWLCADRVVSDLDERSRALLKEVFEGRDTLSDLIYEVAKAHHIDQNDLWTLLASVEKRFAQERGLI